MVLTWWVRCGGGNRWERTRNAAYSGEEVPRQPGGEVGARVHHCLELRSREKPRGCESDCLVETEEHQAEEQLPGMGAGGADSEAVDAFAAAESPGGDNVWSLCKMDREKRLNRASKEKEPMRERREREGTQLAWGSHEQRKRNLSVFRCVCVLTSSV